ncbi:REP-associated tyrosine transposase [Pedobacter sp. SL55]|uniref:REP-associated tyrosine transposase n=1 Tax=Pedobacter sp. SL55 TaxID=2995161 RepID=UPI0022703E60|nr:transposase [Pedobacter sp. SL55]WAC40110.1 transposase [Pedobacter sp. SL55]
MSIKYKFSNPEGLYFVTFAVVGWIDVFTRVVYKDILIEIFAYCIKEKGLRIHSYVIMSNHVHMIISANVGSRLAHIMRDMKKYAAYRILKEIRANIVESRRDWMLFLFAKAGKGNSNNTHYQFWQHDNHPIELDLHNTRVLQQKLAYIHQNPVKAGLVSMASSYIYSSAIDYEGGRGVLKIMLL